MAGMFSYVNRLISGNNVESTLIEAATSGKYDLFLSTCSKVSPSALSMIRDDNGWSLLQLASLGGHTSIVRCILSVSDDSGSLQREVVEYEGPAALTSLLLALANGHEEIGCTLIRCHSPLTGCVSRDRNCLYLICRAGFLSALDDFLNVAGKDFFLNLAHAPDASGYTALHAAALTGKREVIQFLVRQGVDRAKTARDGTNIFHLCCRLSFNQPDSQVSASMLEALLIPPAPSSSSLLDLIPLLLTPDCFGSTPLHIAAAHANAGAIRVILSHFSGSALVAQDNDGYHPPHILCHEFVRCVAELRARQKSNEKNPTVEDGEILKLEQRIRDCLSAMSLFLSSGYPVTCVDYSDFSLLHALATVPNHPSVKEMLEIILMPFLAVDSDMHRINLASPPLSLQGFITSPECSGWTCLHLAYHSSQDTCQASLTAALSASNSHIPSQESSDFFSFLLPHIDLDHLSVFDPALPRNAAAQKERRMWCGAHQRIPLAVRRGLLNDDYTLSAVASYLLNIAKTRAPKVVVLAGAGISTSAGIKDFRSENGVYADKSTAQLFSTEFLRNEPQKFYEQVRSMFLPVVDGLIIPTPAHALLKVLKDKGWLTRVYTQNIDMLERRILNDSSDVVVECHGSFSRAYCSNSECKTPSLLFTDSDMERLFWGPIRDGRVPTCLCCALPLRPDVTFFGEPLPSRFGQVAQIDLPSCDLLLVMGTSLVVHPVASLPSMVGPYAVRMLFNREATGCFQFVPPSAPASVEVSTEKESESPQTQPHRCRSETSSYRDVFISAPCDDSAALFANLVGEGVLFDDIVKECCHHKAGS